MKVAVSEDAEIDREVILLPMLSVRRCQTLGILDRIICLTRCRVPHKGHHSDLVWNCPTVSFRPLLTDLRRGLLSITFGLE